MQKGFFNIFPPSISLKNTGDFQQSGRRGEILSQALLGAVINGHFQNFLPFFVDVSIAVMPFALGEPQRSCPTSRDCVSFRRFGYWAYRDMPTRYECDFSSHGRRIGGPRNGGEQTEVSRIFCNQGGRGYCRLVDCRYASVGVRIRTGLYLLSPGASIFVFAATGYFRATM